MYHAAVQPSLRGRAARTWAALVVGLSVSSIAANAKAADTPPAGSATPPAPAGASAPAAPLTGEQLAAQAYELHTAGKYAEAIATYLRAYEVSNAAVTLLNIATIYDRKLHESALAAEFYRRYLGAPDAEPDLVQKATARLTALKAEESAAKAEAASAETSPAQSAPPAAPAPAPAPEALPPAQHHGVRTAGIVFLTTGLAAVGGGLVLGLLAKDKNDDANALCNGDACSTPHGVDLAHDAGTFATISTVTFISGLALATGGLVMVLAGGGGSAPTRASTALAFAPVLGPTGGGVNLQGGF